MGASSDRYKVGIERRMIEPGRRAGREAQNLNIGNKDAIESHGQQGNMDIQSHNMTFNNSQFSEGKTYLHKQSKRKALKPVESL